MTTAVETMFLALLMLVMVLAAALLVWGTWRVMTVHGYREAWRDECVKNATLESRVMILGLEKQDLVAALGHERKAREMLERHCQQCEADLNDAQESRKLLMADIARMRGPSPSCAACPMKAPWTQAQVEALNAYQTAGEFHPFTCGNDHGGDRVLVAVPSGWTCPGCDYTQDWAHGFMFDHQSELLSAEDAATFMGGRKG